MRITAKKHSPRKLKNSAVLPKSLFKLKSNEQRTLIKSVVPLTISAVATWESQHKAYSEQRYELLHTLVEETILTALQEGYSVTHPGFYVDMIDDPNHYLLFQRKSYARIKAEPHASDDAPAGEEKVSDEDALAPSTPSPARTRSQARDHTNTGRVG